MMIDVKLFRTKIGFRAKYSRGTRTWSGFGETRKAALHSLVDLLVEDDLRIMGVQDSMMVEVGVNKQ